MKLNQILHNRILNNMIKREKYDRCDDTYSKHELDYDINLDILIYMELEKTKEEIEFVNIYNYFYDLAKEIVNIEEM